MAEPREGGLGLIQNRPRCIRLPAGGEHLGEQQTHGTDAVGAVSGVNRDEEAANLVRFQQSYQAAAKVMGVAQRLFDEMLAIAR